MNVVFEFPCITSRGRVQPGDLIDLPDDEARALEQAGMCYEHRVLLPATLLATGQAAAVAAWPPFRRLHHADDAKQGEVLETGNRVLLSTDVAQRPEGIVHRRRRGWICTG